MILWTKFKYGLNLSKLNFITLILTKLPHLTRIGFKTKNSFIMCYLIIKVRFVY